MSFFVRNLEKIWKIFRDYWLKYCLRILSFFVFRLPFLLDLFLAGGGFAGVVFSYILTDVESLDRGLKNISY